jgi:hypothetical protein
MYGNRIGSARHEHRARAQASAIYAKIGIVLKWSNLSACANDGIRIEMEQKAGADDLRKPQPPHTRSPKTRQRITVYCDRLQAVISGRELSASSILGHMLMRSGMCFYVRMPMRTPG